MLLVENLTKKYKSSHIPAVDDLSFRFQKGKIIGFLGPNGAGKTTTISIICGLINQYEGNVKVLGLDRKTQTDEIKRRISVVPQLIALYPTLSCFENLKFFGGLSGINDKELTTLINEYLYQFGLEEHAHKAIKNYSGGMKRRANLIVSLLSNPELLILDEPTAGVDVQSRMMIIEFLKSYNRAGNSIIYTSHLLEEAESICNEILIIDKGKKVIQGIPQELIEMHQVDNLESLFIKLTGNKVRD